MSVFTWWLAARGKYQGTQRVVAAAWMMKHSRMQLLKEYREYSSSRRSEGMWMLSQVERFVVV